MSTLHRTWLWICVCVFAFLVSFSQWVCAVCSPCFSVVTPPSPGLWHSCPPPWASPPSATGTGTSSVIIYKIIWFLAALSIHLLSFLLSGVSLNVQDLAPSCAGALFGKLNPTLYIMVIFLIEFSVLHLSVWPWQVSWTCVERSQVRHSSANSWSSSSNSHCLVHVFPVRHLGSDLLAFCVCFAWKSVRKRWVSDCSVSVEANIWYLILGLKNKTLHGDFVFLCRGPHGVFLGVSHRGHRLVGHHVCPHHCGQPAGPLHLHGLCWGPAGRYRHE